MAILKSQLKELSRESGVYFPSQETLQSKLCMIVPTTIKANTLEQFKKLAAQWVESTPLMRIELEKEILKLGWMRKGVAWIHETDTTVY